MATLNFQSSFPAILKKEAERVLDISLTVGDRFKSADSFSFLLTSASDRYVGKIFRFEHWPPAGKLEYIYALLDKHKIPHEEVIHSSYEHPKFKFGWQLSRYIPGGTVRSLRNDGLWNQEAYLVQVGKLLKQIHTIEFDYYGSLHNRERRFSSFKQFAQFELEKQDFTDLPSDYSWAQTIIDEAKDAVLSSLDQFKWENSTLVHDDVNDSNVMRQEGSPILIDWVDSLAGPPLRDFTTPTFRQDKSVLLALEKGYGKAVDQEELRLHQIMRFVRLGRFFYLEDKDLGELQKMMDRLKALLGSDKPYGV